MSKAHRESLLIRDPAFKLMSGQPRPEFMVIGAAKCGTTSFSYYLPLHPQVRECLPKEPNFWSWQLLSRQQYQQLFVNNQPLLKPSASQGIAGEYSTSSLPHPLVPRRVAARLPDIKLIVLLRNPIDRAYSHYVMVRDAGQERESSFAEIVQREMDEVPALLAAHQRGFLDREQRTQAHRCDLNGKPITVAAHDSAGSTYPLSQEKSLFRYYTTSYLLRSIYHDQLWRWMQLFPSTQLKIIQSEQLLHNRQAVMNEVVEFLGLQAFNFSESDLVHTWRGANPRESKPGGYALIENTIRGQLQDFFQPYNRQLFDLLGERFDWD